MKHLPKIALVLCFVLAAAFSIKSLREPDLWWQIKTGEWILEHLQVPTQDVFSYTHKGAPWINIKWGFEVLAAIVSKTLGADCVYLLQVLVSVLLVWFLFKLSLLLIEHIDKQNNTTAYLATTLLLPLALLSIEYRIIGRPEMVSHLLTIVFLYLLLKYRIQPSKLVYAIVPLQLLWVNFHEAFATGIVLTGIFFTASIIEWKLLKLKETSPEQVKTYGVVLALSIVVIFINPYGYKMLLQPLVIFGQVFENKFTSELLSIKDRRYWEKEAWMAIVWLIAALILVAKIFWDSKKNIQIFFTKLPLAYVITIVAFIYLSTSAYRNIIFLVLVLFPIAALGLYEVLKRFNKIEVTTSIAAVAIPALLYIAIISNKYYEYTNSRDKFGLEVRPSFNPIGAADYVIANKLEGRCFADYLTSSYLLWKIPGFETFIDLRDLDVFPAAFFNTFTEAVMMPEKFAVLDSQYNFSYVVLYRPQFGVLHKYLSEGNGYHLVFADAVAAVYTKQPQPKSFNADVFKLLPTTTPSITANIINAAFNPLYKPGSITLADEKVAAAGYFISINKTDMAEYHLQQILTGDDAFRGNELMGQIYYNKAVRSILPDSTTILLQNAGIHFNKALLQNADYIPALMGMGAVYFQQQFFSQAKNAFEQVTIKEPDNVNAWLSLAGCYKATLQQPGAINEAIRCMEKADDLNPNNPIIQFELGVLYYRAGDCKNSIARLTNVKGFQGLTPQEQQTVETCLKGCGR